VLAVLAAGIVWLVAPGLAVVALSAVIVLLLCGISIVVDRRLG
jgi:hypothetical protein